jgi:hypothetical protein
VDLALRAARVRSRLQSTLEFVVQNSGGWFGSILLTRVLSDAFVLTARCLLLAEQSMMKSLEKENDAKNCTLWRGDNSGVASLWCHPMPRLADGD